jgi:hypothetical protein
VLVPVITGRRPGLEFEGRKAGPSLRARPPDQLALSGSLVACRLLLHLLTSLLDSLAGRRGGVRSSVARGRSGITRGVRSVASSVNGGIASGRSGITGSLGSLTGSRSSISGLVLRRLDRLLLRAAGNGQGSEGSRKSNLRVHLDVPRISWMCLIEQQARRPHHAVRPPARTEF